MLQLCLNPEPMILTTTPNLLEGSAGRIVLNSLASSKVEEKKKINKGFVHHLLIKIFIYGLFTSTMDWVWGCNNILFLLPWRLSLRDEVI